MKYAFVARNQLNKKSGEEQESSAQINADMHGGMKMLIRKIKEQKQFTNLPASIVTENLLLMEIRKENTVVMTAT